METKQVRIITGNPTVVALMDMRFMPGALDQLAAWVKENVPEAGVEGAEDLLPRHGIEEVRKPTDNELIAELAGRKCYNSFGVKGAPRTNEAYLRSMWEGRISHRSTGYHSHMVYFIANVSRRLSHEMFRNYVGHAKDEEGAPSQESTRYCDHPGVFIAPPRIVGDERKIERFRQEMQRGYDAYLTFQEEEIAEFKAKNGVEPKGMDRKRIFEAASFYLHHSAATSFIWTTNPQAHIKLLEERVDAAADLEFQRLGRFWRDVSLEAWSNLYVTLSSSARA